MWFNLAPSGAGAKRFYSMTIYPAIDIKGGRAVRLLQGRADQETVYGENPAAVAARQQAVGHVERGRLGRHAEPALAVHSHALIESAPQHVALAPVLGGDGDARVRDGRLA
jgi:hypothetical protein